jgi:hypothetical protein
MSAGFCSVILSCLCELDAMEEFRSHHSRPDLSERVTEPAWLQQWLRNPV